MKKPSNRERFQELTNQLYRLTYDPLAIGGLVILAGIIFVAIFAPFLTPYANQVGPYTNFGAEYLPPSATHWFGTDNIGKDIFTQIIFGFRISLSIALIVLIVSVPIGVVLGLVAGYYEGWIGALIQRVTEIFLALPALIFALVIAAVLGPNLKDVIIALISLWWNWYARIMYTVTKSLKNQPYVEAARVQGAGPLRIIFREILPNATSTLTSKMMLDSGIYHPHRIRDGVSGDRGATSHARSGSHGGFRIAVSRDLLLDLALSQPCTDPSGSFLQPDRNRNPGSV